MSTTLAQCLGRQVLGLLLLVVWLRQPALAQPPAMPTQKLLLQDKALQTELIDILRLSKANVFTIELRKQQNADLYRVREIFFYERLGKPPYWGRWRNRVLLFYGGPALADICRVTDTTAFSKLVQYTRALLPDSFTDEVINGHTVRNSILIEGHVWEFKLENGRRVWLKDNFGYESPDPPPLPKPR